MRSAVATKERDTTLPMERKLEERLGPGNYKPLARATGLSPSHVSRVLRGLANPTSDTLAMIAEAAHVDLGILMTFIQSKRQANT
jgi:transcriptional regulator with XRE-family HTH domain